MSRGSEGVLCVYICCCRLLTQSHHWTCSWLFCTLVQLISNRSFMCAADKQQWNISISILSSYLVLTLLYISMYLLQRKWSVWYQCIQCALPSDYSLSFCVIAAEMDRLVQRLVWVEILFHRYFPEISSYICGIWWSIDNDAVSRLFYCGRRITLVLLFCNCFTSFHKADIDPEL